MDSFDVTSHVKIPSNELLSTFRAHWKERTALDAFEHRYPEAVEDLISPMLDSFVKAKIRDRIIICVQKDAPELWDELNARAATETVERIVDDWLRLKDAQYTNRTWSAKRDFAIEKQYITGIDAASAFYPNLYYPKSQRYVDSIFNPETRRNLLKELKKLFLVRNGYQIPIREARHN